MKNLAMIGVCPVCSQGRLLVAKEKSSGVLYIACEDCESEWLNPESCKVESATHDTFGPSEFLDLEELDKHPWKAFIK